MQFKLVILSVTCFACLIPSTVSLNLLAAKAVAGQAAGDIAAIGANTIVAEKVAAAKAVSDIASIAAQGVALKGQALKTAATSMAGTAINGALSIGSTIARAGLDMLAASFSGKPALVYEPATIVYQPPVLQDTIVQETIVQEPIVMEYDQAFQVPVQLPPMRTVAVDVRPPVWDIPAPPALSQSVWTVNEAAPSFEIVGPANYPNIYKIAPMPPVFGPLMEAFPFGKK